MKKSSKTLIWVILGLMLTTLILYPKVSKLWKNKNEEGGGNRAMVTSVDAVVIKPIYIAQSDSLRAPLTAD
jgi:hypothetical protein